MTHETCSDLLSAYIDGELNLDRRLAVDDHLRVCDECRTSVRELAMVRDTLSSAPNGSFQALPRWSEIQRAVVRFGAAKSRRRMIARRFAVASAGAAAALITTTASLIQHRAEAGAAGDLERFISAGRAHMSPAMAAAYDDTIEILDRAIKDVQASLAGNPTDPFLTRYLARLERQRIAALRSLAMSTRTMS